MILWVVWIFSVFLQERDAVLILKKKKINTKPKFYNSVCFEKIYFLDSE